MRSWTPASKSLDSSSDKDEVGDRWRRRGRGFGRGFGAGGSSSAGRGSGSLSDSSLVIIAALLAPLAFLPFAPPSREVKLGSLFNLKYAVRAFTPCHN
jgi:hypothetical protein